MTDVIINENNITIELANEENKKILNNLLQLYLHDISLYFPIDFDSEECLYQYDDINIYFDNSENDAYFIKIDNKIVGFILINKIDNQYIVQEMFVLNNYKGKGIGNVAIKKVFDCYKGTWIVRAVPNSPIAEQFWKKVISDYTNNNYQLEHIGKYNRAEFIFINKI